MAEESIFNMSLATLETLRYLMNESHENFLKGDYKEWFMRWHCIWKEIAPFMDAKKDAKKEDKSRETGERMNMELLRQLSKKEMVRGSISSELYSQIYNFEMFIRDKMKEKKMIMPLKDDLDIWR